MLVLSRKVGEEIVVPSHDMTVTVLEIVGDRVRLGIEAPRSVPVHRKEIWRQIQVQGRQQEAEVHGTSPLRVLIADSDVNLVSSYAEFLERQGYEVAAVASGLECLARLRQFAPQVLVLEPSLPWGGADGVLARMQEEPALKDVPVIVLTYGRDRGALYRLAPYRVADYLIKPQSPRRLAERISAIARRLSEGRSHAAPS